MKFKAIIVFLVIALVAPLFAVYSAEPIKNRRPVHNDRQRRPVRERLGSGDQDRP